MISPHILVVGKRSSHHAFCNRDAGGKLPSARKKPQSAETRLRSCTAILHQISYCWNSGTETMPGCKFCKKFAPSARS